MGTDERDAAIEFDREATAAVRGTTLAAGFEPGERSAAGYRRLRVRDGEPFVARTDLGGAPSSGRLRSLLAFVHLSDLHVTDVQSPARAEFLDRHGDSDSPLASAVGRVGTYRAQEALTHQVVEAMARAVRELEGGPATGAPIMFAISTGDSTDNCQENELDAYVALLEGGREVHPDSGDPSRYEGVGAPDAYDPRYWHPDGTPPGEADDLPRERHGFPVVPGILDACRRPFVAIGLGLPWYAVYGNHDALLGGTLPPGDGLVARAVGSEKPLGLHAGTDVLALLSGNETSPSVGTWGLLDGPTLGVTPDRRRRPVDRSAWIRAHLGPHGAPVGHGYDEEAASKARGFYAFDAGSVRCIVLDTVNPEGGWQGSLSGDQLDWLERELAGGHRAYLDACGNEVVTGAADRVFLLFSHHPAETLINDFSPEGARRVLAAELEHLLARFPNVVCWFNGHTHIHAVTCLRSGSGRGLWQVTTASHIDWPQQARVVELAVDEETGDLVIAVAVLDHVGAPEPREAALDDPLTLAGWSRELSLNAWQGRTAEGTDEDAEPTGRGARWDRNVVLVVPAPFSLAATRSPQASSAAHS